jgi:hypothetical protein
MWRRAGVVAVSGLAQFVGVFLLFLWAALTWLRPSPWVLVAAIGALVLTGWLGGLAGKRLFRPGGRVSALGTAAGSSLGLMGALFLMGLAGLGRNDLRNACAVFGAGGAGGLLGSFLSLRSRQS